MPTGAAGNPVPFLNQPLVPAAASPGSSNFSLLLSGTGFVPGAGIDFDNTGISATFVDSEHLSVTIPAANVTTARTAAVSVINPPPGGGKSNVVFFQVAAPETSVYFAPAANSPFQTYEPFGITVGDFNEDGKAGPCHRSWTSSCSHSSATATAHLRRRKTLPCECRARLTTTSRRPMLGRSPLQTSIAVVIWVWRRG